MWASASAALSALAGVASAWISCSILLNSFKLLVTPVSAWMRVPTILAYLVSMAQAWALGSVVARGSDPADAARMGALLCACACGAQMGAVFCVAGGAGALAAQRGPPERGAAERAASKHDGDGRSAAERGAAPVAPDVCAPPPIDVLLLHDMRASKTVSRGLLLATFRAAPLLFVRLVV